MTLEEIKTRIVELENLQVEKFTVEIQKRNELQVLETQANAIKKQINDNIFTSMPEALELEELRNAVKWSES